jgi:hypothetical protein
MDCGWPVDSVKRSIERLETISARLFRPRLHIGLINLNDIGSGCEQILDLGVHCRRIVECHLLIVFVEIVLRLLRHREWTWHRHFDHAVRVGAQEFHIFHLDGMPTAYLSCDARYRIGMA